MEYYRINEKKGNTMCLLLFTPKIILFKQTDIITSSSPVKNVAPLPQNSVLAQYGQHTLAMNNKRL